MYIILAQCYIHMEKTCMEYILSLFLTSWRGIRKVWRELCTSLHVYYISIRSLLLIYLKFIALDTIQWWRVRSRSYLFSSLRDSLVWNIRESGLWTFPKLDGEGGWQLSELVCITRFSNGCFLSRGIMVPPSCLYHLEWSVFRMGYPPLGVKSLSMPRHWWKGKKKTKQT